MGSGVSSEPPTLTPPGPDIADIFSMVVDPRRYEELRGVDFGFENLVLAGGGTKGLAYCGMLKALEDLGILQKIKRFGGASMGSAIVTKLAIGADAADLLHSFTIDLKDLAYDGGSCTALPNLVRKRGIHPGNRILKHFRNICKYHTGITDMTFKQLYDERGIELCLVSTNVTDGKPEYLHPKTTPGETITMGIRKSMSIPLIFQPITDDVGNCIVDGGLLNNYPVNAFDGWYLDMDRNNCFLQMMDTQEPPFGKFNEKTLGALVFDGLHSERNEDLYLRRLGFQRINRPDTKLARVKAGKVNAVWERKFALAKFKDAVRIFMKNLKACDLDKSGDISREEFRLTLSKCPKDVCKVLFGDTNDVESLFVDIDSDNTGDISYAEIVKYMREKANKIRNTYHIQQGLSVYFMSLLDAARQFIQDNLTQQGDTDRTIGIFTDYITTTDFGLELEDKIFLVKQGWEATVNFLKERKDTLNHPKPQPDELEPPLSSRRSSARRPSCLFD